MKPIYRPALSAILVASWVALAGAEEKPGPAQAEYDQWVKCYTDESRTAPFPEGAARRRKSNSRSNSSSPPYSATRTAPDVGPPDRRSTVSPSTICTSRPIGGPKAWKRTGTGEERKRALLRRTTGHGLTSCSRNYPTVILVSPRRTVAWHCKRPKWGACVSVSTTERSRRRRCLRSFASPVPGSNRGFRSSRRKARCDYTARK